MFLGTRDFSNVLSRNDFSDIRRCIRIYPSYDNDIAARDPLWHSRVIMNAFFRSAANIAVPTGVQTFDEISVRCSARTMAKTYMPNKPIKYGIRFYAIIGNPSMYIHSIYDNNSGSRIGMSPADAYCSLIRFLRGVAMRKFDQKMDKRDSASALRCLQIAHQTQPSPQRTGRLLVTDNFYTRHLLAKQIQQLTDNEVNLLGTVRFNNIDSLKSKNVKDAVETLKRKYVPRGHWYLCQAVNLDKNGSNECSVA